MFSVQIRNVWSLCMAAFEDEETQKNGLVVVQYKVGDQIKGQRPNRRLVWMGAGYSRHLPGTITSIHVCLSRQSLPYVRLLKIALDYHTGHRVRIHEGTISTHATCYVFPRRLF